MTAATLNQKFGKFDAKLFSVLTIRPLAWAVIGVPFMFLGLCLLARPEQPEHIAGGLLISILGYMFWVGLLFFFQLYVLWRKFSCPSCGKVSQNGEVLREVVYNNVPYCDGDDYSNTTTAECPHCEEALYKYKGGVFFRI